MNLAPVSVRSESEMGDWVGRVILGSVTTPDAIISPARYYNQVKVMSRETQMEPAWSKDESARRSVAALLLVRLNTSVIDLIRMPVGW